MGVENGIKCQAIEPTTRPSIEATSNPKTRYTTPRTTTQNYLFWSTSSVGKKCALDELFGCVSSTSSCCHTVNINGKIFHRRPGRRRVFSNRMWAIYVQRMQLTMYLKRASTFKVICYATQCSKNLQGYVTKIVNRLGTSLFQCILVCSLLHWPSSDLLTVKKLNFCVFQKVDTATITFQ